MFRLSRGPSYEQETGKGTASGLSIPLRSDGNGPIGRMGSVPSLAGRFQLPHLDLPIGTLRIDGHGILSFEHSRQVEVDGFRVFLVKQKT